jgi:hypothetical protein
MAEYYEGTKHYDSARFWYASVIRKYPESELASRARDRMVALADSPGQPAKKLAWLIEKLPQNAESKAIAQVPLLPTGDSQIRLASGEEQVETEGQKNTKTTTR